ncbi:hypothetical protein D3Z55_02970 [Clostridiaceae bacterium]|nr:hypothetical protein [Clostridiaceae bacterium]
MDYFPSERRGHRLKALFGSDNFRIPFHFGGGSIRNSHGSCVAEKVCLAAPAYGLKQTETSCDVSCTLRIKSVCTEKNQVCGNQGGTAA